jgi:hypothetical protein
MICVTSQLIPNGMVNALFVVIKALKTNDVAICRMKIDFLKIGAPSVSIQNILQDIHDLNQFAPILGLNQPILTLRQFSICRPNFSYILINFIVVVPSFELKSK